MIEIVLWGCVRPPAADVVKVTESVEIVPATSGVGVTATCATSGVTNATDGLSLKVTSAEVSAAVRVAVSTAGSLTVKVAEPVPEVVAVGGVMTAWLPDCAVSATVSPITGLA